MVITGLKDLCQTAFLKVETVNQQPWKPWGCSSPDHFYEHKIFLKVLFIFRERERARAKEGGGAEEEEREKLQQIPI